MAKFEILYAKDYKKGIKKLNKDDLKAVEAVVDRLACGERLEDKFCDHALKGEFFGLRECHVKPNLLLIYERRYDVLVLVCVSVGSHSELFG